MIANLLPRFILWPENVNFLADFRLEVFISARLPPDARSYRAGFPIMSNVTDVQIFDPKLAPSAGSAPHRLVSCHNPGRWGGVEDLAPGRGRIDSQ